jgi:hypothetical protein
MSFLEMTKQYLLSANPRPGTTILGGHSVKRVLWETETAVIFQDPEGHFWRYLPTGRQIGAVVTRSPQNFV